MKFDYVVHGDDTVITLRRRDGTLVQTTIDTEDLPKLYGKSLRVKSSKDKPPYVSVYLGKVKGRNIDVYLHRLLTGAPKGMVVDHWDNDTLNNRKNNLYVVTRQQNNQNQKGALVTSKSGVRGVYWYKGAWVSQLSVGSKTKYIGRFKTMEEAEEAVKQARRVLMPHSKEGAELWMKT